MDDLGLPSVFRVGEFAAWAALQKSAAAFEGAGRPVEPAQEAPRAEPEPLSGELHPVGEDRYRIRLTVDAEFKELLEKARSILSHPVPDGSVVEILRRGLKFPIVASSANRRTSPRAIATQFGKTPTTRTIPTSVSASNIPPTAIRMRRNMDLR